MPVVSKLETELIEEIRELPANEIREILDFVYFIKIKKTVEPTQAYFWSKKWQQMEKEVEVDKKTGQVIGNGSTKGLLKELRKH